MKSLNIHLNAIYMCINPKYFCLKLNEDKTKQSIADEKDGCDISFLPLCTRHQCRSKPLVDTHDITVV